MSEEEKEAIYEIEDIKFDERTNRKIEIILNLINKLQKENEESKELYDKLFNGYNKLVQEHLELEKENEELQNKKQLEIDTLEEVLKWKAKYHLLSRKIDVISKDKIREKIKELGNGTYDAKIILEKLLEDNK